MKGKEKMSPKDVNTTISQDDIDLGDAEDFKLPTDGVHNGNLAGIELGRNKADTRDQFVLTVTLSPEDPDAPNLPMRTYLGWPTPEDKDVFWGSRTAFGAMVKSIKDTLTAFGGQESGGINKQAVLAFLTGKIGMACKVKVKQDNRKDANGQPTGEMQANVDKLMPA